MKRIIIVFIVMLFGIGLVGCKEKEQYANSSIIITIKSSYKNKFINREFILSDFQFENVESFSYAGWSEENSCGFLFIHLKKHGTSEVDKALQHFEKLDFVENVEKMPIIKAFVE